MLFAFYRPTGLSPNDLRLRIAAGAAHAVHFVRPHIMDTNEQRELVALYAAWTDAALLTALGPDCEQYQPEVIPLLEVHRIRRPGMGMAQVFPQIIA